MPQDRLSTPSVRQDLTEAIGQTPLLRLRRLSEETGCEILAKAEFMNPGGSIKDRPALGMILEAERSGALRPGGVIVEGTAGNTGAGLALCGLSRGYRCVLVVPENLCAEKIAHLRLLGAELHLAPERPFGHPEHFQQTAQKLAREIEGGWWADQFNNLANQETHYRTTGPEIWTQTEGRLTAFVTSVGSGGTLAGISRFLKEQKPSLQVFAADPAGAAMHAWFTRRELCPSPGESIVEGIGQVTVTPNVREARVDGAFIIRDQTAVETVYRLRHDEGLLLGPSSGINVAGAIAVARQLGPGHTIVTILCDGGSRYASRLYNPAWLQAHHLTPPRLPPR